jgi:protein-tyrosine phosphatase
MTTHAAKWIELEGAVNVRDVGGLPAVDGRTVQPGVLIRSANLQHLTASDVTRLVEELGVRRVVDLRTDVEVAKSEPGPMHTQPTVTISHLSLYPDNGAGEVEPDALLPWQGERFASKRRPAVASYLRYLDRRPDSLVAALRAIAEPDGATLVHCAAGKDRTGVVVALALTVAGVDRDVIAADYAHTQSQIEAILEHLARNSLYNHETTRPDQVPPASAEVMLAVLDAIEEDFGGVITWLTGQGWTAGDTERLQAKLLG